MTFTEELAGEIDDVFKTQWAERSGNVVPEADNVGLGNDAVRLEGTVLYADLAESSALVKPFPPGTQPRFTNPFSFPRAESSARTTEKSPRSTATRSWQFTSATTRTPQQPKPPCKSTT